MLHKGFVPVRKKGKLPCETISAKYDLEYGSAVIEMHKDSIKPGQKVVIVDDLQLTFSSLSLSDIDRFIVSVLLDAPNMISELGPRNRKKFGCILDRYTRTLAFDISLYENIIQGLGVFRQVLPVV